MSIITRLGRALGRAVNLGERDLNGFFTALFGTGGIPDTLKGPEDAFRRIGVVYRCLRVIVDTAAVELDAVDAGGKVVKSADIDRWLTQPFVGMHYASWMQRIVGQLVLTGGSRLLVVDPANEWSMLPVSLNDCRPDGDAYPPQRFVYNTSSYPADRVLSIQASDPTQLLDAISSVEAAGLSADAGFYARRHAATAIKNGAFIGAVLKYARNFKDKAQRDEFVAGWESMITRAKKSGSFPVLEAGNDFSIEKLGLSFVDLALPEMIAMSDREVARAMGVPPAYLGEDSNSLANFAEQRRIFLETTLEGTWRTIESALNAGLAARLKGRVKLRFRRADCPIAQEVRQERGNALRASVNVTMTPNEWRKEMGLPPWPADVGDTILQPLMVQPVSVPPAKDGRSVDLTPDAAAGFARFLAPPVKRESTSESTGTVNGRPAAVRRAYYTMFDLTLGDVERADDGSRRGRGLIGRYAKEFGKLLDGVRDELIAAAEAGKPLEYDRDAHRKAATQKRLALGRVALVNGGNIGAAQIANLRGRAEARAYTVTDAAVAELLARAEAWTALTDNETYTAVAALQAEAIEKGWSLTALTDAIKTMHGLSLARAEVIARTEVIASLNAGTIDAYEESGEVESKEWLATSDDRTRDAHVEADGQTVGLDDSFDVDGETLDYPGDPKGDPGNIINCRCTVLPVLRKAK